MTRCFSFIATQDSCFRFYFKRAGLKSSTTDLGNGTIMHCWIPKKHNPSKATLLLIHGFGANAMWQFNGIIPQFMSKFNVYVPDLLFFGESYTTRAERSESFQAQCVMSLMEAHNVTKMDVFGLSYGGFVAYSMAAQFKERVGRVSLGCAGVCFEEKDAENIKLFKVTTVEKAVSILLPQTPEKARELVRLSFYKPPPSLPACFLWDFIEEIDRSIKVKTACKSELKRSHMERSKLCSEKSIRIKKKMFDLILTKWFDLKPERVMSL